MAKAKIIQGKKKCKTYRHVPLKKIVGETLEAIGSTITDGNWGHEQCIQLFFSNGNRHDFVILTDEDIDL